MSYDNIFGGGFVSIMSLLASHNCHQYIITGIPSLSASHHYQHRASIISCHYQLHVSASITSVSSPDHYHHHITAIITSDSLLASCNIFRFTSLPGSCHCPHHIIVNNTLLLASYYCQHHIIVSIMQ